MNKHTKQGKTDDGFTVMEMTALYQGNKILGFVPVGAITEKEIAQDKSLRIKEGVRVLTDGKRGVPFGDSAEILMGKDAIIQEIVSGRGK